MKLKTLITIAAISMIPNAHGAAGIYEELLWVTTTAPFSYGTSTFYEIDSDSSNLFGAAEFHGANLGTFTVGDDLYLAGQQKSSKNNSTDVTGHTLFWSLDGGTTSASLSYGFQADLGSGNQRWGTDNTGGLTGNILAGLAPGSYTLSVWSIISTNSVNAPATIFNNQGGSNYNATFSVIPEPASAALGLLGSLVLLRRRRI